MPRVPVHTVESAPEGSRDNLKAVESRFGKVLNIFGEMAHAPAVIGLFTAAEGTIAEHTSLDRKTREAIHLTVAQVNDCRYCQAAYTGAAKMAGFTADEAIAIRRGEADFDERLAALLPVARETALHKATSTTPPGSVPSTPGGPTSNCSKPSPTSSGPCSPTTSTTSSAPRSTSPGRRHSTTKPPPDNARTPHTGERRRASPGVQGGSAVCVVAPRRSPTSPGDMPRRRPSHQIAGTGQIMLRGLTTLPSRWCGRRAGTDRGRSDA